MNLTKAISLACARLREDRHFNGLYVMEASCQSEAGKREDARLDGLSDSETERYINDYECANFHIDTVTPMYCGPKEPEDSRYLKVEFDYDALDRDFRKFLLPFLGGDESLLPEKIRLDGGDTEFMTEDFRNRPLGSE